MKKKFQLTLSMVSSLDGRTTTPAGSIQSSPEDTAAFEKLRNSIPVMIIGRKTAQKHTLRLPELHGPLRIVMTRNPSQYTGLVRPGKLEFTDETPTELISRLQKQGIRAALLAGGSTTNAAFLDACLITNAFFTYEPVVSGTGKGIFFRPGRTAIFHLRDIQQLNTRGTLRMHYAISYEHNTD